MAIRGVVSTIFFRAEDQTGDFFNDFQNYFVDGRIIYGTNYAYRQFEVSPITVSRDNITTSFNIKFPATVSNISLVETALDNRHFVYANLYRWSDNEGLENPSTFNDLVLGAGHCLSAVSDYNTITLQVGSYSKTVESDFPARKISWEILGPLSFRR